MTNSISIIEDLFRYNDWANARIFDLARELTNAQLDAPRELGFGSLRNTIFHLLTAEEIWLERWQLVPWRPFPTDSQGMALEDMEALLRQVAQARQQLINEERKTLWKREVAFKDSRGNEYREPLIMLLIHVANHGIYHRAQALSYLKSHGRTVPVGLDYLLYKLARPSLEQTPDTVAGLRALGLEVATKAGWQATWDGWLMERYFAYHDWANDQVLSAMLDQNDAVLDRPFDMGLGSLRQTVVHLVNAESWWWENWENRPQSFPAYAAHDLASLQQRLQELRQQRNEFLGNLNPDQSQEACVAKFGELDVRVRIEESLLQLCCHGTHHRAQLVNMLRHSGLKIPAVDVVDWWRGLPTDAA